MTEVIMECLSCCMGYDGDTDETGSWSEPRSEGIRLHIMTGRRLLISLQITNLNTTVQELISKINAESRLGFPQLERKLKYGELYLEDEHTLDYYNIKTNSIINLCEVIRGGSEFFQLVSKCPGCSGVGSCDLLMRCGEIFYIKDAAEDAWSALCNTFNIKGSVIKMIKENSDSPAVRCADVVHRLLHADHSITWNNIKIQLGQHYPHLVEEM